MPAKGQTGWTHSESTRLKISAALKKAHAEGRHVSWTKINKGSGLVRGFTGKHTDETKAKISRNRRGKCIGNKHALGHTPFNKGKPHPIHTAEWRAKVSAATSGKNHWNWKGGINSENRRERNSTKHKDWSLSVLAKDRWTCQKCGYRGRELVAHHIKKWSENKSLRFDINNGMTLCRSCHCEIHKPRLGTGKNLQSAVQFSAS